MDKIRLTGFVLRQACERLERELNAVLAADMPDPAQQRATLERVAEIQSQCGVWLDIAAGRRPSPPEGSLTLLPAAADAYRGTTQPRPPLAGETLH